MRRLVTTLGAAALLAGVLAAPANAAGPACRVTNGAKAYAGDGSALTRALAAAHDGDRLEVRGTCAGTYRISVDVELAGYPDRRTPTVLDGRLRDRVLVVDVETTVRLTDLVITRGRPAAGGGGGISSAGDLTLTRVSLTGNATAAGYPGGGILNGGPLEITRSSVTGNRSGAEGGGLYNTGGGGDVVTYRSVFSGNVTDGVGGGLFNEGTVRMNNSLVTHNTAGDDGGGITSVNTLVLNNTPVVGNQPNDCVC